MIPARRIFLVGLLSVLSLAGASCKSVMTSDSRMKHGGIRYTIAPDKRFHRVEKGRNGSLMYDSPELTVICENGKLQVNGQNVAMVKDGDHVEITNGLQVLVNGQTRGDVNTGANENRERLQKSKIEVSKR